MLKLEQPSISIRWDHIQLHLQLRDPSAIMPASQVIVTQIKLGWNWLKHLSSSLFFSLPFTLPLLSKGNKKYNRYIHSKADRWACSIYKNINKQECMHIKSWHLLLLLAFALSAHAHAHAHACIPLQHKTWQIYQACLPGGYHCQLPVNYSVVMPNKILLIIWKLANQHMHAWMLLGSALTCCYKHNSQI